MVQIVARINHWRIYMLRNVMLMVVIVMSLAATGLAATVQLPRTGQSACYDTAGATIACAGSGQDGEKQAGAPWPDPRFNDNSDGTVTDNLTGLVWLKNANCTDTIASIAKTNGHLTWSNAMTWSNNLASGACGLTDGSTAGQWRLPNRKELQSLVDRSRSYPALPSGHPFSAFQDFCWSSSTRANTSWFVNMSSGWVEGSDKDNGNYCVWPVRAGQ